MYVRKKTISRPEEEVSIKIGSLTIEQVDGISAPLEDEEKAVAATLRHPELYTVYRTVCQSLNNASPVAVLTPKLLESEFDFVVLGWLQEQVLEFNGLRLATKDAPSGESSAAAPTA